MPRPARGRRTLRDAVRHARAEASRWRTRVSVDRHRAVVSRSVTHTSTSSTCRLSPSGTTRRAVVARPVGSPAASIVAGRSSTPHQAKPCSAGRYVAWRRETGRGRTIILRAGGGGCRA
ncbi:MAG: hypothetical protein L0J70_07065, partial [Corynebacterium sp.]|nr:hypothetical protein [Corynebacterium sp.]